MKEFDLIIVGAGASGLLAGISASRFLKNILILEKNESPGKKLKLTGNGRCNLTNSANLDEFIKAFGKNGKFLYPSFLNFFSKEIIELLENENIECVEEDAGRIFPVNKDAVDITNVFLNKLKNLKIIYNTVVLDLICEANTILGVKTENINYFSKTVIIATGGCSYPLTGSTGDGFKFAKNLGHKTIKARPALVSLESSSVKELQGLTLDKVLVSFFINNKKKKEEIGSILFTHYGVSGPLVLNNSKFLVDELLAQKKVELRLDFLPDLNFKEADTKFLNFIEKHPNMFFINILDFLLPNKLCLRLLKNLKIDTSVLTKNVSSRERLAVIHLLKEFVIEISKTRPLKEAMLTAGGVVLSEINPKTMESKLVSNLYFVGETLDIDAISGGYNLQAAFSTGWLAGEAASGKIIVNKWLDFYFYFC